MSQDGIVSLAHQVWLETPPSSWDHFHPSPNSIESRSCPAPCLAPRKGCKPQGIPNPAQTPGTDTTPHIQLCPEHLPTSRLALSQEKFSHSIPYGTFPMHGYRDRQQVLTILRLQAGFGTAGFTCRGREKGKHPPKYLQEQLCDTAGDREGQEGSHPNSLKSHPRIPLIPRANSFRKFGQNWASCPMDGAQGTAHGPGFPWKEDEGGRAQLAGSCWGWSCSRTPGQGTGQCQREQQVTQPWLCAPTTSSSHGVGSEP